MCATKPMAVGLEENNGNLGIDVYKDKTEGKWVNQPEHGQLLGREQIGQEIRHNKLTSN